MASEMGQNDLILIDQLGEQHFDELRDEFVKEEISENMEEMFQCCVG